jgi:hypothetical protein
VEYVASISYPIKPGLDLVILGALLALSVAARKLVMRQHWQDVSLGYLGDPFLHHIIGDPLRPQDTSEIKPPAREQPTN